MKSPQGVRKILKTIQKKLNVVMQKVNHYSKEAYLGRIFYLGVHQGDTSLIWGYAEGYHFDLGVNKYQKVENPWFSWHIAMIDQHFFIIFNFYCSY
jgi:hypothetical protein